MEQQHNRHYYGRLCCCSISVYFLSRMSELASNGYWRFCNTLHILIWFCDILSENQSLNGIVGSFKMHQCHWIICISTVCYVIKSSCACVFLVEEWRSKWFLERRWQKCGSDELIKAMSDINDHVRLAAVSACSKAAELRQMDKQQNKLGNLSMHYFYNL